MSASADTAESFETDTEIAILGAGLSGLGMAVALRRSGREDFVVLERAGELGGTWRDNTYPGCGCDIPSVLYSYREEPNPDWSRAFALQPEIRAYMDRVAHTHDVECFMRFGHEVLGARFDAGAARWIIHTTAGRHRAQILILATGALAEPALPDLPGLDRFAGASFHSARWDHSVKLEGRRVATVGNGASAIQFVPEIQSRVAHLSVFQRTPSWVLPRQNVRIPAPVRGALARHPGLGASARAAAFSFQEATHLGFSHPLLMGLGEHQGRRQLARQVADPVLREQLTPRFRLGCKRVLFSNRWYPAITAANAEVVTAGIREVLPDGILDVDGVRHPADTIIFGTGFHVTDSPVASLIRGPSGELLSDRWGGSPRAHLGIGVAGFPNLFFLLGPNTGLGHNSVLVMIEAQIAYLLQVLAHRDRLGVATVAPTSAAQAKSTAGVDAGTEGSVWRTGGCESWYLDRNGRNSALWPGSVRAYERRLARLAPGEYAWQPADSGSATVSV